MSGVAGDPGPLLDVAPCGWLTFTDDGAVQLCNRTLLDLLGYEREEIVGRHVETLLTVGSRVFYQTHLFPLLRLEGEVEEIFLTLRRKHGGDVGVLLNARRRERDARWVTDCVLLRIVERRKYEDALLRAKRDADEARAAAESSRRELAVAHDLLEQHARELEVAQQQLERAREAAERANEAKSDFLATMSHELRTPLNAIAGYVQLLEVGVYGSITDEQRETLERVHRSEQHLLRLINDVLNLAKIESGRLEYRLETVPLSQLVEAVLPMIEPQLSSRSLSWSTDVPSDLVARTDREKAGQVLLNLLSNASKFTAPGGRIGVEGARDASDPGRLVLRVIDSGIGIPRERLADVFEPFVQVGTSDKARAEGTGLGLAISRDLARGMGGDLTVESAPGQGSTFILVLPRAGDDTGDEPGQGL